MAPIKQETAVAWVRVSGVAAIHGAITITWLIYNLYLPELLAQFGFPETAARAILVVENLLVVLVEPTMGGLSDQTTRWWNSRFPFIFGGVIVAATTFMVVPVIVVAGAPTGMARWLLPLFLTAWALAMATFRSPSLFLLKKCATTQGLPQAAAIFTVITALFAAIRPFSTEFILNLGPLAAFAIGSGGLLVGAFVLRLLLPDGAPDPDVEQAVGSGVFSDLQRYLPPLALIFGVGLGAAWSLRFSTSAVSKLLALQAPQIDPTWVMSIFFFLIMGAALPLGRVAAKMGNRRVMLMGMAAAAGGLVLVAFGSNIFLLLPVTVFVVVGLSVVTTGAVPLALALMPSRWGGLGIGMYFGGFALAISGFHALFSPNLALASPTLVAFFGAGSFLISWLCVLASRNVLPDENPI